MSLNPKYFQKKLLSSDITKFEEHIFTFFVSLLCMTAYMASDVFLPALPEMTAYFNTTPAQAQMTVSIYLIGLASAQILHGRMADRFGKKNVLMSALPIFLASTLGCILSQDIHILIFFRLIQALCASACLVIGRSIFTDFFEPRRAQRAFAVLVPLVSLSPALAPAIGGFLATHFQWQSSFVFALFFGLIVTAFVAFYVPKPLKKNADPDAKVEVHHEHIFTVLFMMTTDLKFVRMLVSLSVATFAWWIYVAGAPLMLHRANLTAEQIGLVYFPAIVPYITCAFIARSLLKTVQAERIVSLGMFGLFWGAFIFPVLVVFHFLNVWTIMSGIVLITASNGFIVSLSMAAGIARFQKHSGLAAGLLGTVQLLAGAAASFIVGLVADKLDFQFFSLMEFTSAVLGCLVYLLISKVKSGDP